MPAENNWRLALGGGSIHHLLNVPNLNTIQSLRSRVGLPLLPRPAREWLKFARLAPFLLSSTSAQLQVCLGALLSVCLVLRRWPMITAESWPAAEG
jgi:hypothetical protein